MLEQLVCFCVRRRGVVLVVAFLVALVSLAATKKLSIDAVPDVTNVQVSVLTSAPGLSPSEVEQYITYPIETALNGIPDATEIRSVSRTAVSSVTVVFQDHVNVWFARQLVAERMKIAEVDIPPEYGHPELAPVSTGLGEIFRVFPGIDRRQTLADGIADAAGLGGVVQAAFGARRHRGQRHGRRGQTVPSRARSEAAGGLQTVAWAGVRDAASQQRQHRRRLH